MSRRPAPVVVVIACGLLVAACSDDDETAETSGSGPLTTETQVTTPDTSGDDTTTSASAATSTSAEPTTMPPTTVPETTTTVNDEAATKRAVERAVVEERAAYVNAILHPNSSKAEQRLRDAYAASIVEDALGNLRTARENGWQGRPHPSIPDVARVEGDVELLDGPPATRARATECSIDSTILVEPGTGPNGEDVIVNDQVVARRDIVTLVLERGRWRFLSVDRRGEWLGEASCPPA